MDPAELHRLTDLDFEALMQDLWQEILGVPLEIFAPGADRGIDLRYLAPTGKQLVIQCKHWWRSGAAALKRHIRTTERPKVERLAPDRYILLTSADLSVDSCNQLLASLAPWSKGPEDVVGARNLVLELERRPAVVHRHLRLWLSSTAILSSVVHQEVHVRSAALVAEANETLRLWADNPSRPRAQQLLEEHHVLVVAGVPGIGKTALAHVLCTLYATEGFEILDIGQDIDEANSVWEEHSKQLFFYDDFLGQTSLVEKLGKNEDGRLLSLMRRCKTSPSKRLILTTREYILEEARSHYEKLARHDFDVLKCVVDISDYGRLTRAKLLYNHLYNSGLDNLVLSSFRTSWVPNDNWTPELQPSAHCISYSLRRRLR